MQSNPQKEQFRTVFDLPVSKLRRVHCEHAPYSTMRSKISSLISGCHHRARRDRRSECSCSSDRTQEVVMPISEERRLPSDVRCGLIRLPSQTTGTTRFTVVLLIRSA
jgi:hypothetical protein